MENGEDKDKLYDHLMSVIKCYLPEPWQSQGRKA